MLSGFFFLQTVFNYAKLKEQIMRYSKKLKYKLNKHKIFLKKEEDLTPEELYQQRLRDKKRIARKH